MALKRSALNNIAMIHAKSLEASAELHAMLRTVGRSLGSLYKVTWGLLYVGQYSLEDERYYGEIKGVQKPFNRTTCKGHRHKAS